MLKKPQNVYMPIDRLQAKVLKRKDPVKKAEWVDNFVLALSEEAEDPFAKELLEKAQFDYYKDTLRTWRLKAKKSLSFNGNEPSDKQIHEWCCEEYGDEYIEALHLLSKNSKRFSKKIQNLLSKNPQDAPNGNAGVDSKSATSCDQFTADGDTREGSLDEKSGTSANHCGPRQAKNGDASHREAEDESATVSNPFALDMPGPDKGEQPRGCNTSNVPSSDGPEDDKNLDWHKIVSQSLGLHDQEADPRGGSSEGIGAVDESPLMIGEMTAQQSTAQYSSPVVDSSAKTRKKGTVANHGNRSHVETSTTVPAVVAPEDVRKPYGANRLVMLSKAEGDKLRELYGENLEMAIDILDSYIANSRKGQKYKSHASVLRRGNWVWNKVAETLLSEKKLENETKPRQRYLTSAEISERNAAIGWQRLQEDLARKRTGTDK